MDESLERIIRQALEEARAKGRDYLGPTQAAVAATRNVRSAMTAINALAAVE